MNTHLDYSQTPHVMMFKYGARDKKRFYLLGFFPFVLLLALMILTACVPSANVQRDPAIVYFTSGNPGARLIGSELTHNRIANAINANIITDAQELRQKLQATEVQVVLIVGGLPDLTDFSPLREAYAAGKKFGFINVPLAEFSEAIGYTCLADDLNELVPLTGPYAQFALTYISVTGSTKEEREKVLAARLETCGDEIPLGIKGTVVISGGEAFGRIVSEKDLEVFKRRFADFIGSGGVVVEVSPLE